MLRRAHRTKPRQKAAARFPAPCKVPATGARLFSEVQRKPSAFLRHVDLLWRSNSKGSVDRSDEYASLIFFPRSDLFLPPLSTSGSDRSSVWATLLSS